MACRGMGGLRREARLNASKAMGKMRVMQEMAHTKSTCRPERSGVHSCRQRLIVVQRRHSIPEESRAICVFERAAVAEPSSSNLFLRLFACLLQRQTRHSSSKEYSEVIYKAMIQTSWGCLSGMYSMPGVEIKF